MKKNSLAIVIPAFNENETIIDVILSVQKYGDVIVVDDGSSDSTIESVNSTSAITISHEKNLGYEASISSGIHYAINEKYQYIVTMDADGEHNSLNIPDFVNKLNQGFEIVIGSRQKKNRAIEIFFGVLTSNLLDGVSDPLCGMKGYSYDLFNKYGFFDNKKMIGTELLAYAIRDNVSISELSVSTKKRKDDSRYGSEIKSFFKILRTIYLFFIIVFSKEGER
jgi:glycosyltransferase involved in cell wall biosynthesis